MRFFLRGWIRIRSDRIQNPGHAYRHHQFRHQPVVICCSSCLQLNIHTQAETNTRTQFHFGTHTHVFTINYTNTQMYICNIQINTNTCFTHKTQCLSNTHDTYWKWNSLMTPHVNLVVGQSVIIKAWKWNRNTH